MATDKKAADVAPIRKTVEDWAAQKRPVDWIFAAARAGQRWPIGLEMSEADFDAALELAAHVPVR